MVRTPAYQPFYCEENIWKLAQDVLPGAGERWVVLITGTVSPAQGGGCTLAQQRSAGPGGGLVWWDYHVILLVRQSRWLVWDLDTTLETPILAESYISATFPIDPSALSVADVRFRLVPAESYCNQLVSDRSHMRDAAGAFLRAPPPWPAPGHGANTLARFLDPNQSYLGDVLDLGMLTRLLRSSAVR